MTEEQWLACDWVWKVNLRELPGLSYRRFDYFLAYALPLFAGGSLCSSCRNALDLLAAGADQSPPKSKSLWGACIDRPRPPECRACRLVHAVRLCADGTILMSECWNRLFDRICNERFKTFGHYRVTEEDGAALAVLRDIFGNPFRSASLDAAWRTAQALAIANAVYEGREQLSGHLDNARLAVLSDALEEAGCTDADILTHLRSPGPHVRGCWALDLVLGKS
jgi:hypothetical protein